MELLKILHPLDMSIIKLVLPLNVLESLMASVENELSSYKVVTPVVQAPNDDIKFFIIS